MLSASSRRLVGIVLALRLATVAGCSSQLPPSPQKLQTAGTVATVGSVVVTVSEAVAADRQERFAKVDGPSRLTRAIESELTHAARLDRQSGRVLDILNAELTLTMRQCGTPTLGQITRAHVKHT